MGLYMQDVADVVEKGLVLLPVEKLVVEMGFVMVPYQRTNPKQSLMIRQVMANIMNSYPVMMAICVSPEPLPVVTMVRITQVTTIGLLHNSHALLMFDFTLIGIIALI